MTRRRIVVWTVAGIGVALLIAGATMFRETRIDYYSDDAFLTRVGQYRVNCYRWEIDAGTKGPWRVYNQYSCLTRRRIVHRCQQTDGTGGWIDITCPPNIHFTAAP
jgi:hypothetical protein